VTFYTLALVSSKKYMVASSADLGQELAVDTVSLEAQG
jgi:hypothetical protein